MKKYKKFIAVMLAFVLCAGTFMSDMGTKEVKAEGITYEDSFDFVVETEDEVAPGNEVALDVSVTCNKPMDCMMSYFSVTCFEYVDHCGVSWGDEIILLGSDGEEDIIITAENESTIPFAAGQTRTFRVTGTIPEEWVDGSSYIEFVVSARTTEGQEAELDGVFAYGYSDPDMGDDGEDDGSIEDGDVDYTPDEEYGPIETWLYPADGDMVPGNQVEYEFEVYNNTEEDKNYTVKFYHAKLGEKTEIEVITSVYDDESWESEPIDSISDVTVASGDFQYFVLEWEIPENWEDEKSQFVVEITDGTYTAYDAYPWYIAPSYNPGDILLSDVSIDLADRDDIQFVGNEKRKTIPVDITVEASDEWELKTVDLDWYSLNENYADISEYEVDKIASAIDEQTYRAELEINKYMAEDRYGLEYMVLYFEKAADYDVNFDQEVDENDIEIMTLFYTTFGNYEYDEEIDESIKVPVTEENPVNMYGSDRCDNDLGHLSYGGQADFTITAAGSDNNYPKVTGLELLTDTDQMGLTDNVTVKVDWEEDKSGIEYIELTWSDMEGEIVRSACWESEDMEDTVGKGSLELTTEDFEFEEDEEYDDDYYCDSVWKEEGEYYISGIVIGDWAGNYLEYEADYEVNRQKLTTYDYIFDGESLKEVYEEVANISFSRGDVHAYVPVATKSSERADAKNKKNGKAPKTCEICGKPAPTGTTGTIYYPSKYYIEDSIYTGGKVGCEYIEIYDYKGNEIHPAYYDLEYPDNATKVGSHKVNIVFKGNYKGTVTKSYMILPAAVPYLDGEVSGAHNSVKLEWDKSTGASGYYVQWGKVVEDEDGWFGVEKWSSKKSTTKTSYTVKDLSANTLYEFRVTPYYKKNDKKYYDEYEYTSFECKTKKNVKAPSSVTATLNGEYNNISLKWKASASSGVAGYNVYYKLGSEPYELLAVTEGTSTDEAVNLVDGGKYTFKVVPYYMDGEEMVESAYSKTTTAYIMKAPGKAKVTKSSSKVKVSWTNISGESGYEISQSEDPNVDGKITTYKTTSGKSKTISAKKGVTYYYKVRAYKTVNGKKIYAPWSEATAYTRK